MVSTCGWKSAAARALGARNSNRAICQVDGPESRAVGSPGGPDRPNRFSTTGRRENRCITQLPIRSEAGGSTARSAAHRLAGSERHVWIGPGVVLPRVRFLPGGFLNNPAYPDSDCTATLLPIRRINNRLIDLSFLRFYNHIIDFLCLRVHQLILAPNGDKTRTFLGRFWTVFMRFVGAKPLDGQAKRVQNGR